jgi:DNA replication protein DnaC
LGLDQAARSLPELVEEATREQLAPGAFLDRILTRQLEHKDERRVATMLKLSGLPPGKTLEGFDWSFQPRVDRRQIETVATCSFVREKVNVLFLGPPGVGKSHLAAALGVKAIQHGFAAAHFVLDDLMQVLKADAAIAPARLRAKRYLNAGLLIVDEVGFRPLDRAEANLFFRLVSARYEQGSIVLTSTKHVRDWPEIFAGDEILTTAILDRLLAPRRRHPHRRQELPAARTRRPAQTGGIHFFTPCTERRTEQVMTHPRCVNLGVPKLRNFGCHWTPDGNGAAPRAEPPGFPVPVAVARPRVTEAPALRPATAQETRRLFLQQGFNEALDPLPHPGFQGPIVSHIRLLRFPVVLWIGLRA